MPFDASIYGPGVAAILSQPRVMPLVRGAAAPPETRERIRQVVLPESARAGLYLFSGFWDEAHDIAQSIGNPDGSYWHALVHRQEPDAGNAAYWFRCVGTHPIFPALARRAAEIEPSIGVPWDPFAFVDYCENAAAQPGGERERRALEIQRVEWELLFDYCFNSARRG